MRTRFICSPRFIARALLTVCVLFSALSVSLTPLEAKPKYAGIVMDAKTGKVLYSHRSNNLSYPASLTKMMTLYLMFEALESGKLTKKTRIRMSKFAASKPPSKLGIKPGRSLSAEQAIYALVTKSANDVATAVAEHLGGSERNFAVRMTNRAKSLGMNRTTFKNASGLTAKGQITTAKDMALLGIALREHYPKYYRYFSTRSFKYGKRKYGNHNRLLGKVKGVDGIKTGYTRLSGFNLVTSVRVNKRDIVAVVMGGKSGKSRNAQMNSLISKYLRKATRRAKRQPLIAQISKSQFGNIVVASALKLPKRGPIPVFRQQNNDPARLRIEQAHIASIAFAPTPPAIAKRNVDAIRSKLLAMNSNNAPIPKQNPFGTDQITTASIPTSANMDSPNYRPSGWQVQVGAVPTKVHALDLLSKARKKFPTLTKSSKYGNLRDYLQPVEKNGGTLYRARLAGFLSKDSARAACKAMKKRKIDCLAIKG